MISMGKSGGVYGSGNTGLPQAFSGGKKTQNNQKSIFGAKNKSSVTDIRRMLARNRERPDAGGEQLGTGFHRYKFPELQ